MKKIFPHMLVAATFCLSPITVFAADEFNAAPGLTAVGAPLAMRGYDAVDFIQLDNRISGRAKYSAVYQGIAFYFSSQENKKAFEKNT